MKILSKFLNTHVFFGAVALLMLQNVSLANPVVTRLTPPSELFSSARSAPVIARFLPDQRFDLQATVQPDEEGKTIQSARFLIDEMALKQDVSLKSCAQGCLPNVSKSASIATVRAVSLLKPGIHKFTVQVTQNDGLTAIATGNFEIIPLVPGGQKVKNIIILLGDGMGAAQRTAARIVAQGYAQGKSITPLAMDTFPVTGMVKTSSLNSLVTDSAPGMAS